MKDIMKIVEQLEHWLNLRTERERVYVLACTIVVLTFVWFAVWENPYQDIRKSQLTEIETIQNKILSFKEQNQIMTKLIKNAVLIKKREVLKKELREVNTKINAVSSQLVTPAQMSNALKSILEKTSGLTLLRLTNAEGTMIASALSKEESQTHQIKLYQHNFVLEMQGNYFSVMNYLRNVEKSPYHFFIDSIDYKVLQYPEANITLKLHTVSKERDLIND